jgi:hypothetical protein
MIRWRDRLLQVSSQVVILGAGWTPEPYESQWLALLISKLMMARR